MPARRPDLLTRVAAALVAILAAQNSGAQEGAAGGQSAAEMVKPALESIDRGLRYLAGQQRPDGSMGVGYGRNVAVVGLTGMAMLASGSTPGRGPYGEEIDRCVDYLIKNSKPSGFITVPGATSQGPMYGHGFATLMLAEAYGMSPREDLRDKLAAAVKLIVTTQNKEGGWRYQPRPVEADISVTICQVMALRAARNAGLHVPAETIDRTVAYVRRCQNRDGGFGYMPSDRSSRFPRSAAGIVALYSAGVYGGEEVERGLEYLERQRPRVLRPAAPHYLYGHYYAAQAMWQTGGQRWQAWYPAIRDELVARQRPGGDWLYPVCPQYATAMVCIILQTPNDLVPIFQR